jgi:hypothetical protein
MGRFNTIKSCFLPIVLIGGASVAFVLYKNGLPIFMQCDGGRLNVQGLLAQGNYANLIGSCIRQSSRETAPKHADSEFPSVIQKELPVNHSAGQDDRISVFLKPLPSKSLYAPGLIVNGFPGPTHILRITPPNVSFNTTVAVGFSAFLKHSSSGAEQHHLSVDLPGEENAESNPHDLPISSQILRESDEQKRQEVDRLAKAQAEREQAEQLAKQAEQKRPEVDRLAKAQAEREQAEQLAKQAEQKRLDADRLAKAQADREQAEQLAKQAEQKRQESDRLAKGQADREQAEQLARQAEQKR